MEDQADPVCGMQGIIEKHGHWFCSQKCIEKWEKEQGIEPEKEEKEFCPSCETKSMPWYREKLYLFSGIFILLLIISYLTSPPLFSAMADYLALIWWAILLGLLIGGVIDYYVPRSYISRYLSRPAKRTILYSVIFGFLMSACSHGILAIAIQLYKKGASIPAVIAFLLASPWANLPVTFLLFGFFGVNRALLLIISAIIIAIITGFVYQFLDNRNMIEKNMNSEEIDEEFSIFDDVAKRMSGYEFTKSNISGAARGILSGSFALAKMVLWWILIGMILASIARAFVPTDFFMTYMGPTILGLGVTLFFATIIEICSEGSSPLAFEIFRQTGAFGNSFTFLMAGVATDYTEIGLLWSNVGKKTAIFLPLITVPQILVLGYLFNVVL
ncbi:MAG: permease [Candidatus Altiarchaeota archaeon]|nr:permease [Candidatus Altiarchaeota archaeon]MBU4341991.1 permease [Candidatus Altiarchaeota archaeon]MBU4437635.1 permease [Candidatus Altiarchaeota archaeon]